MKKINFIKAFIPKGDFSEKYEHGGIMVRHLAAVLDEKMGAYECYECTVPIGEYDENEVQKAFVEFSAKMNALDLEQAKADKIAEITAYDKSPAVNAFYLNGEQHWLDFNLRDEYLMVMRELLIRVEKRRAFGLMESVLSCLSQ